MAVASSLAQYTNIAKSEPITVVIGEGAKSHTIYAHTDVLLKSRFFRSILSSGFAEADTKTIMLPEDNFRAVKYFIDWLYSGTFSYDAAADKQFERIWLFADKSCEEAYCNDVMDSMLEYFRARRWLLSQPRLTYLYNIGMGKSQVAKFGVKGTASSMMIYPRYWITRRQAFFDTLRQGGEGSSDLMIAILEEIIMQRSEPDSEHSPLRMQGCHFHELKDGSPCSKENEVG